MSDYFAAIPDELKQREQWLLWDSSADSPRQPHWKGDFFGISWSDPADWHSFEEAVSAAQTRESWGIGYVMATDNDDYARGLYGCLDLDGVYDTDTESKKDWLPGLSTFFDEGEGYVEWSPSGTGIHIPLVGQDEPEWWSDSHFTADEHEGVEYLTNKFVTFTGDKLTGAGESVSDADPAPFLADCYETLNDESPVTQTKHDYNSSASADDAELSREEIEDALDHVDSNCSYPEWRDMLFAIHDWDAGSAGQQVAESWSMGPGWDDQADELIERIWSGAEQGSGITVGTLIYKANQNGWTSSRETPDLQGPQADVDTDDSGATADGGTVTESASASVEPVVRSAKEQVQGIIQEYNEDIIQMKTARHQIALTLLQEYHFVYPETRVQGWRSVLYVYDDETGIYEPRGEEFLQSKLEAIAGDFVTNQLVNEIVAKVERSASADRDCFERHPEKLVVGNGILDLHTGTLEPHTPDAYHQQRITVDWNPDAGDPERVDSFLHKIVDAGDVPTLYRLMAHTLYKEYISEKAAILLGSGQNGKSVFLEFLEQFLQPSGDNVAHRELQDFDDDDYAANNLRGRMANLATEIGEQKLTDTTMFKKLTGRDTIDAQVKFEKPVTFENYATMMFATNEMPVFGQDNHAVWRRWVYIEFPYTFNAADPDAKDPVDKQLLLDELTAQSELEALLVRCQQEIQRWHADPEAAFFDDAMPPDEIRDKMKKAAEPVYAFASTCLKPADEEAFVKKSRVREAYRAYADEQDLPTLPENTFGERLIELRDFGISPKQRRINGTMTRVYEGVEMTSRGRQVLGLDENDDDAQQGIDETEQPDSRAVVLSELREMTKENDNEPVPRAGVIWRSVGGHIGKSTAEQALEHLAKSGEVIVDGDDVMPTDI